MRRRDFLAALGGMGALAAGACGRDGDAAARVREAEGAGVGAAADERPGGGTARTSPPRRPDRALDRIGLQLYTLRSLMADDVPGTLRAVAEIGYREVELAGLYGLAPRAMRRHLETAGLSAPSGHVDLARLRAEPQLVFAEALALGHRYVTVPSIPGRERTPEGYRRVAADLERAGARARDEGLVVAYHNHDFELAPLEGGRSGWDILLEETDPELVKMQMDVFWAVNGGADPVAYLRAHPGRFTMVHAKDRTAGGDMAAVGEGVIDFAAVLEAAFDAGVEHVFVEHDRPEDPLASVRRSYRALSALEV